MGLIKIEDDLTRSASSDYALTANQGKILQDIKITGSSGTTAPANASMDNNSVYIKYNTIVNSDWITMIKNYYYPVGSIYMSTTSTSPVTLFGGSWSPLEGRFLLCNSDSYTAGSTGGATTVTLTSAQTGMQGHNTDWTGSHQHYFYIRIAKNTEAGTNRAIYNSGGSNSVTYYSSTDGAHTHTVSAANASNSHTNMPPYLAVYMWKRTG